MELIMVSTEFLLGLNEKLHLKGLSLFLEKEEKWTT